jgi:hypothetical protein
MRYEYGNVFKAHHVQEQKERDAKAKAISNNKKHVEPKMHTMTYQCNLLTSMQEEDGYSLLNALANSTEDQLDIFEADVVRDMIQYKWNCYAARAHWLSGVIYLGYTVTLALYIDDIYLRDEVFVGVARQNPEANTNLLIVLGVLLLRAVVIDMTQLRVAGAQYFEDTWNYVDMLNIGLGYWNIYNQLYSGTLELVTKLVLIGVIIVCLLKLFFYMRIIESFSYIVTMIMSVFSDLQTFLAFYGILILMFSLIFDIISKNPAAEYAQIGPFVGNLFTTLRLSLGDFDFGVLEETDAKKGALDSDQHMLYWIIWLLMVVFSALIFLNFIIAEVSNSYSKINANINKLVYKERAKLINEAEDGMSKRVRQTDRKRFPRFIITRE